jgi:hypothetical protein
LKNALAGISANSTMKLQPSQLIERCIFSFLSKLKNNKIAAVSAK